MKIAFVYSHLNGKEWLLYHYPELWKEICDSIAAVNASLCKTKVSKEKTMRGELKYSPADMNEALGKQFKDKEWREQRFNYYVTGDEVVTRNIVSLEYEKQKELIKASDNVPISSYHQTDYVKKKVAVEVQFGKYAFIEFDLFVKHLGFYLRNEIDLGIEIVPSKVLQAMMSSGPGYYERTLTHILRQGRASPSVPFILIGIEPD